MMIAILLVYVIPRIETIYKEAHTTLPALTTVIIGMSHFLRSYGVFVLIGLVGIGFMVRLMLREPRIKREFDRFILTIPLFGGLIKAKILVIFADFLSILLESGITIYRALDIVSAATSNSYYRSEIEGLIKDIRAGKHLSLAMGGDYLERRIKGESLSGAEMTASGRRLDCFTIELSTAVKVGEQTGTLAKMLAKASYRYEREIDTTIKSLSSLLEPVVIIVIGAIVGVIVLAIMMPFFNMVQVIK
ncbi:MAG: type II secretion system F family protein [Patescibacteria group bacterium]